MATNPFGNQAPQAPAQERGKAQGAKATPLDKTFIERVAAGVKYAFTGKADFFGPGEPLTPVALDNVKGRRFDFPMAANVAYRPRSEQSEIGIDFPTLRRVSDPAQGGLDILRLVIETRKDQMDGQPWTIALKNGAAAGAKVEAITKALKRPDGVTPYRQWQRMLLEDQLVLDASVVYLRPIAGGVLLEAVDGATIKRLLDQGGRVPLPPAPAYQQNIKGLPAVDYTLDELVYNMRNPRTNRIYGLSPVEQVVNIVNLSLRRYVHLLQYYTEGNVPEAFASSPESWTPDQISQFQTWWDTLMEGDTAQRRHLKFVPNGINLTFTKDPKLKDEMDEWLARIVCFAFSISPQPFVKEMNRATAETAEQTAKQEGIEPLKLSWKAFMDELLERGFQSDDCEFVYADEEITDPSVKATVISTYVGKQAVMTLDEARGLLGLPELTPGQREELKPPPPPMAPGPDAGLGDEGGSAAPGPPSPDSAAEKKLAKAIAATLVKKKSSRLTGIAAPPGSLSAA